MIWALVSSTANTPIRWATGRWVAGRWATGFPTPLGARRRPPVRGSRAVGSCPLAAPPPGGRAPGARPGRSRRPVAEGGGEPVGFALAQGHVHPHALEVLGDLLGALGHRVLVEEGLDLGGPAPGR